MPEDGWIDRSIDRSVGRIRASPFAVVRNARKVHPIRDSVRLRGIFSPRGPVIGRYALSGEGNARVSP